MTGNLRNRRRFLLESAAVAMAAGVGKGIRAQEQKKSGEEAKTREGMVGRGIDFLRVKGQAADGSFSKQVGIGVTALTATAMLRLGRSPEDPTVAKALKFITDNVQPTGGIHLPNGRLMTYETCVAVVCLVEANRDGRYSDVLKKADRFLKELPFDANEGHDPSSFFYGGEGYGGQGRPDRANHA